MLCSPTRNEPWGAGLDRLSNRTVPRVIVKTYAGNVSERPRDRYGRPVEVYSDDAFPSVPERVSLSNLEAWTYADEYLRAGLPFHAHEVFEQRWRCWPINERLAWQALAQWAAALTHEARGNPIGARSVARRASENLEACEVIPSEINEGVVLQSLVRLLSL